MQAAAALLQNTGFPGAAQAKTGNLSASRAAGSSAALRPAAKTPQTFGKQSLSHKARVFTAAAVTEAPPTPVVATAPSV